MSRVTFYLIACLMVLTTVACGDGQRRGLETVTTVGPQCRNRGLYAGACITQNLVTNELGCLNLVCAKERNDGFYEAYNTGIVNNGTPCGPHKICNQGVCVHQGKVSSTKTWLFQAGFLGSETFPCIIPALPVTINSAQKPTAAHQPPTKKRA